MINSINFKANFINKTAVQKLHNDGHYRDYSVNFIELNPFSSTDRIALSMLSKSWAYAPKNFSSQISKTMDMIFSRQNKEKQPKFFAITLQQINFENLSFEKILGVTQIVNNRTNINIEYIQAHPQHAAKINQVTGKIAKVREYKHLGMAMLESLLKHYPNKNITLSSDVLAKNFYKKCGFKKIPWEWNGFILKVR